MDVDAVIAGLSAAQRKALQSPHWQDWKPPTVCQPRLLGCGSRRQAAFENAPRIFRRPFRSDRKGREMKMTEAHVEAVADALETVKTMIFDAVHLGVDQASINAASSRADRLAEVAAHLRELVK